jgi:hypothetical protein
VLAPQQLPPHLLPLPAPAPGMTTTVPTPPPGGQQISSQVSQPVLAYGYSSVAPPPARVRGTWGWFAGGAVAVGLGVAAALIYVHTHGDAPAAVAAPAPVVMTPTVEPAPPEPAQKPRQIELRFDSLPSAGVYAEGHSAELCRTPCAFNVDLSDGEATDHRKFVVRSEGYLDKTIAVDLGGAQREFRVTLEREVAVASDTQPERRRVTAKSKKSGTKTDAKTEAKAETKAVDTSDKALDKPGTDDKPVLKHDDALEKPDRKADPIIDPTDTHDPFKKHK